MALLKLPLRHDVYHYSYSIELDSILYNLEFRYNTHAAKWIMDISTNLFEPIITGIPLLLGVNLFGRYVNANLPPGILFLVNMGISNEDGDRDDFGDNVILMYLEE